MSERTALRETDLPLRLRGQGKVRDVYEVDDETLLLVASDRVSAFDVVLDRAVPAKGEVLTLLTAWWLEQLDGRIPHHLLAVRPEEILERAPALEGYETTWARRSMLVRRTDPLPVECVVRGYLSGSAWQEYRRSGTLAGEPLAGQLLESALLDPPVFSPATKAEEGHDENIPFDEVIRRLGRDTAEELRERSLEIYDFGARTARERGILLADTKFEFGRDPEGRILLIDEVMTPDSSRFWPEEAYAEGRGQPSLDKQPIRDWLAEREEWDRTPPAPPLPDRVVGETTERYREIFRRLTGADVDEWPLPSIPAP